MNMKSNSLLLTIPLSLALISCDNRNRDADKDKSPDDSAPHALSAVLLTEPPEDAVTIRTQGGKVKLDWAS